MLAGTAGGRDLEPRTVTLVNLDDRRVGQISRKRRGFVRWFVNFAWLFCCSKGVIYVATLESDHVEGDSRVVVVVSPVARVAFSVYG